MCLDGQPKKKAAVWSQGLDSDSGLKRRHRPSVCSSFEWAPLFPHKTASQCSIYCIKRLEFSSWHPWDWCRGATQFSLTEDERDFVVLGCGVWSEGPPVSETESKMWSGAKVEWIELMVPMSGPLKWLYSQYFSILTFVLTCLCRGIHISGWPRAPCSKSKSFSPSLYVISHLTPSPPLSHFPLFVPSYFSLTSLSLMCCPAFPSQFSPVRIRVRSVWKSCVQTHSKYRLDLASVLQ